jgi:hypothetical protein
MSAGEAKSLFLKVKEYSGFTSVKHTILFELNISYNKKKLLIFTLMV